MKNKTRKLVEFNFALSEMSEIVEAGENLGFAQ